MKAAAGDSERREELIRQLGKGRTMGFAAAIARCTAEEADQWSAEAGWPDEVRIRRAAADIERAREDRKRDRPSPVGAERGERERVFATAREVEERRPSRGFVDVDVDGWEEPEPGVGADPDRVEDLASAAAGYVEVEVGSDDPVEGGDQVGDAVGDGDAGREFVDLAAAAAVVQLVPRQRTSAAPIDEPLPGPGAEGELRSFLRTLRPADLMPVERDAWAVGVAVSLLRLLDSIEEVLGRVRPRDAEACLCGDVHAAGCWRPGCGCTRPRVAGAEPVAGSWDAGPAVPAHDKVCRICGHIVTAAYMAVTGQTTHAVCRPHPDIPQTDAQGATP